MFYRFQHEDTTAKTYIYVDTRYHLRTYQEWLLIGTDGETESEECLDDDNDVGWLTSEQQLFVVKATNFINFLFYFI